MGNKKILKIKGEPIFPITSYECVMDEDGKTLKQYLNEGSTDEIFFDIDPNEIFNIEKEVISDVVITGLKIVGNESAKEVEIGKEITLQIEYTPSNTTQKGLTVVSSDTSKATCRVNTNDNTIIVTGVAIGSSTITVSSSINTPLQSTININIVEVKPVIS